jgi:3-hydroxyacyl-CoA dehydrogenase
MKKIFARKSNQVVIYDTNPQQLERALQQIKQVADEIAVRRISASKDLEFALDGANYVQECVFEKVEVKQAVFKEIEAVLKKLQGELPILASSSSAIPISEIGKDLEENTKRFSLVAHPVNPPYSIPIVELVPSPLTNPEILELTKEILKDVGQVPVVLRKETRGFLLNRLQYALLAEAFRIVDDGLASPEDVDLCLTAGLARRWVFMGPFQTIDMNAPLGVLDYCQRYSNTILDIVKDQDNTRRWSDALIDKVNEGARSMNGPVDEISSALQWRDERLGKLEAFLKQEESLKEFRDRKRKRNKD